MSILTVEALVAGLGIVSKLAGRVDPEVGLALDITDDAFALYHQQNQKEASIAAQMIKAIQRTHLSEDRQKIVLQLLAKKVSYD